jgi:hypothetical protein
MTFISLYAVFVTVLYITSTVLEVTDVNDFRGLKYRISTDRRSSWTRQDISIWFENFKSNLKYPLMRTIGKATVPISNVNPNETTPWINSLSQKLFCRQLFPNSSYYLYHVRKAAGTTIRELVRESAQRNGVKLYETEGKTLNAKLLDIKSIISFISLRDPIDRIISLYWYEHVSWYVSVAKEPQRVVPFAVWLSAWRDGGSWKERILLEYPTSNYVEVENYYVKMLVGWNANSGVGHGSGRVGRKELEKAKEILSRFDVVLITEWLQENEMQKQLLSMITPMAKRQMYLLMEQKYTKNSIQQQERQQRLSKRRLMNQQIRSQPERNNNHLQQQHTRRRLQELLSSISFGEPFVRYEFSAESLKISQNHHAIFFQDKRIKGDYALRNTSAHFYTPNIVSYDSSRIYCY